MQTSSHTRPVPSPVRARTVHGPAAVGSRVADLARALVIRLSLLARDERGEGVISTAIAVLVMAFLGVAMWVAFNELFTTAAENVSNQVQQIGG